MAPKEERLPISARWRTPIDCERGGVCFTALSGELSRPHPGQRLSDRHGRDQAPHSSSPSSQRPLPLVGILVPPQRLRAVELPLAVAAGVHALLGLQGGGPSEGRRQDCLEVSKKVVRHRRSRLFQGGGRGVSARVEHTWKVMQ